MNRIRNGKAAITYLIGDAHNGHTVRNVSVSCVNMIPDGNWLQQFRQEWDRANKARHPTEAISIIISYSKNEADPDNPDHIAMVEAVGNEFVKAHYPGRRALICVQRDGRSGLLHAHLLISDVEMTTLRGCNKTEYHKETIERWSDEIVSKYTTFDAGKKTADKCTRTERAKREEGAYCWKDDLRQRIAAAISESKTENDFMERLTAHGVSATRRSSKKRGDFLTYELTDFSNVPDGEKIPTYTKARSYNLGSDMFEIEAIRSAILSKQGISENKAEIAPEPTDNFELDTPPITSRPMFKDSAEEIEQQRKKNEKRRRAIQQAMRKQRHADLMKKYGRTSNYANKTDRDYERSL